MRQWKAVDGSYLNSRYGDGGGRAAVSALQGNMRTIPELKNYNTTVEAVVGVETDAPWSVLRTWFRASGVQWPKEWVTWYPDEQQQEAA